MCSTSRAICSATSPSLTARTAQVRPGIAGEDTATMLLDHESGLTCVVDCSYSTYQAVEQFPQTVIEVDGSEGTIRLEKGYGLVVKGRSGDTVRDASPPLLPWAQRPWHNVQESVAAIQQDWIDCLKAGPRAGDQWRRQHQDLRAGRSRLSQRRHSGCRWSPASLLA